MLPHSHSESVHRGHRHQGKTQQRSPSELQWPSDGCLSDARLRPGIPCALKHRRPRRPAISPRPPPRAPSSRVRRRARARRDHAQVQRATRRAADLQNPRSWRRLPGPGDRTCTRCVARARIVAVRLLLGAAHATRRSSRSAGLATPARWPVFASPRRDRRAANEIVMRIVSPAAAPPSANR